MIGFRKIGDVPVALLPIGRGYVVAEGARVTPLTREAADELTNQATVLYRPLPATVKTIGALLRFGFRNNRRDLWTFAVMGVAVSVIGLLVPIMTGAVLGTFVAEARRDLIVQGACVVIASALVVAALSILQNIAVLRIESRSTAAMQVGMWTRLLSLPASFFSRYSTGELGTTVLGISTAQEMLSGMTTTAALGLLTGLANLVLVYFYSVWLALLATGSGPGGRGVRHGRRVLRGALAAPPLPARAAHVLAGVPTPHRHTEAAGDRGRGPGVRRVGGAVHRGPLPGRLRAPRTEHGHHLQRGLPGAVFSRPVRRGRRPARWQRAGRRLPVLLRRVQPAARRLPAIHRRRHRRDGRGADAGGAAAHPGGRARGRTTSRPTPATSRAGSRSRR